MDPALAWERLKSTLNGTTVSLHSSRPGAKDHGTGFFVGPGLVLTCAHVVLPGDRAAEHVEGVWHRGTEEVPLAFCVDDIDVRPFDGGRGPDLALLRVTGGPPRDQPCVALSRGSGRPRDGQKLYAYGHPGHDYSGGDSFTLEIVGPSWHKSGAELLKVGGSELWAGASGSPVIDEDSGCVIGVVRAKQRRTAPTADHEARLVPANVVWDTFPLIGREQRTGYGPLDDWLALLNDEQLQEGNWHQAGPTRTGYLTLLREATAELGPVDALHTMLSGGSGGSGGPLPAFGLRVPLRAKPGHDAEDGGAGCRPVDARALLPGAHIVGEAGTGKSTLLRTVARDWAQEWLDGVVGDYVPVYAPASLLAEAIGNESWNPFRWLSYAVSWDLSSAASRCAGEVEFDRVLPPPEVFGKPPYPARKWLVLIDGVDEVANKTRRTQVQRALALFANSAQCTLVVTSRDPFQIKDIGKASLENLRLCRLSGQVRRELAEKSLAAFGVDAVAEVDAFLSELERLGLSELAMRPMLCVVLCAVFVTSGARGLQGGRFQLFERLTEILLAGAEAQQGNAPLPGEDLRRILAAHAGELREPRPGLRPSLDELIRQIPSRHAGQSEDDSWIEDVRTHLCQAGLLAPDAPQNQPFSHELLVDYFAACRWASTTPLDSRAVRQVAEDCMKRERESYALFRAAHLLTTAPGLIADELGAWSTRRRNQAAVMITKLATEAAPVPPELARAAVRVLERWARKAKSDVPPPRHSPDLPTASGWPEWAAARVAAAPVAQLRHKGWS